MVIRFVTWYIFLFFAFSSVVYMPEGHMIAWLYILYCMYIHVYLKGWLDYESSVFGYPVFGSYEAFADTEADTISC